MKPFLRDMSFGALAAIALLAAFLHAPSSDAATLTFSGSGLSQQGGTSVCTYTSMSASSAGNWSIVCGAGSRTVTISPPVSGTVCDSFASMSESSAGVWTVQGCTSLAPSVTLDDPSQTGQTYPSGVTYTLKATASAPTGRVVSTVEFFSNGTLIHAGTISGSQYVLDWTPAAGTYLVFARVTDNTGATGDSATRQMTFNATSAIYYIHPDNLGTPRVITRATDNQVVWRWDNTEPFANSNPNENPGGLGAFAYNLRFPGQYFDAETGKHYNYFRDYDPAIGRYLQSDPIGLKGGLNTFGYVDASPVANMDPLGLIAGAGGAAAGGFGGIGGAGYGSSSGSGAIARGFQKLWNQMCNPPEKCKLVEALHVVEPNANDFELIPGKDGKVVRFGGRLYCRYRCPDGSFKLTSQYTGPGQITSQAQAWEACAKEEEK